MEPTSSRHRYESMLRRVTDLPSLPDVVNKIVEQIGQPNTPASEIARLISYDPGLTSKVLRMVNSSAYGFQRQISSVQHAIMILGFGTVRGIVLSASIFKLFENRPNQGLDPTEFWRHSISTAIGARVLTSQLKIPYAEDAFSAGMLHDIGKMIMNQYFSMDYHQVIEATRQHKIAPHGQGFKDLERHILETDHAEIGYQLAQRWKLPLTFTEVIRFHHAPEEAVDAPALVYVIALANAFSHLIYLNYSVFNPELIPQTVRDYFDYDPENPEPFEALFKQIAGEMEGVEELLTSLKR